jgi:predicted nucleotidyltransferase
MATGLEDRIRDCLASHREVVAAYLFGSHAEGRAHRESDVDVGVLLDHGLCPDAKVRFDRRVALTAELIAALHENDVDLVILNDASPLLGRRIAIEGRLVHCADRAAEHAFRRDVQIRAADLAPFIEKARRRLLEVLRR